MKVLNYEPWLLPMVNETVLIDEIMTQINESSLLERNL